ncbi:MAG: 1,4-dihydroxy-6-naphthoate synthase [Planctomycetota bacterium]
MIRLAISTCPNDTFAFDALLRGQIDTRGIDLSIDLMDIQTLNERLVAGDYDGGKISFAQASRHDRWWVLPVGSALGFGVGPLLLAAAEKTIPQSSRQLTLCPGSGTTASFLMEYFYPQSTQIRNVVFSEIMPALQRGEADFGVCIHEGRFTWQASGLFCVEDLGERWERETNLPLPLGGLVMQRSVSRDVAIQVSQIVRQSLLAAQADPATALVSMRKYAQEFDDDVLMRHVDLYVNDWTVDLGPVGRQALEAFWRAGGAAAGPQFLAA